MIESCFPEDFLNAWNRSNASGAPTEAKERLNNLMAFLKTEVEGEEQLSLAMKGFDLRKDEDKKTLRVKKEDLEISKVKTLTAAGLLTTVIQELKKCVFCGEALLDYHINQYVALKPFVLSGFSKSFYVDNLVSGVDNEIQLEEFMTDANDVLNKGGFELRNWTFTSSETNSSKSSDLLGLPWDSHLDVIAFSIDWIEDIKLEIITKKTMLSIAHRLFDPFGVASPVMLCPKLMLQETWKMSLGWDAEIKGSLKHSTIVVQRS
ncbi:uncharacterized protein CDAR_450651 [Caerostris darwini]|uniref:Uncharacterized protein n=1 Tax=Caerostris darwini TaxID=1538125 RepID=A0AAV4P7Y9_9ARAC|nr:uncharacterized protein CDAR_450651 [Caerostris darwini]